jgi:hypothetical protein
MVVEGKGRMHACPRATKPPRPRGSTPDHGLPESCATAYNATAVGRPRCDAAGPGVYSQLVRRLGAAHYYLSEAGVPRARHEQCSAASRRNRSGGSAGAHWCHDETRSSRASLHGSETSRRPCKAVSYRQINGQYVVCMKLTS